MKKIIVLLTVVMAMVLASCSIHGTPAGLVGKWKTENAADGYYMEIKADDTIWQVTPNGSVKTGEITKCTCDELTTKVSVTIGSVTTSQESTVKYELSCDTLKTTTTSGSTTVTQTLKRVN